VPVQKLNDQGECVNPILSELSRMEIVAPKEASRLER
jgi:hypothetical protein